MMFSLVPIVNQIGLWTSGTYVGALNTFLWAGRLTLFSFANWIYGAPTLTAPTECVRVIPTLNYFWADISCEQWLPSICESAGKSGGSDEASPARSSDVSAETVDSVETVDVDIVPGHPEEQIDVEVVSESNVIDLPK